MELYILDSAMERASVVDRFESLIWTERYAAHGDFELKISANEANLIQFHIGNFLGLDRSERIMMVEQIERTVSDDGKETLVVKGRSLEALLKSRPARNKNEVLANITVSITGALNVVARRVISESYITSTGGVSYGLSADDVFPGITMGTNYILGNLPTPAGAIQWELKEGVDLYSDLVDLIESYGLGFRMIRRQVYAQIRFDVIRGNDRTRRQTTFDPVVFGLDFGTIKNISELRSNTEYYNVAYVTAGEEFREVYLDGIDPADATGFNRRVLMVSGQLEDGEPDPDSVLDQQGQEALQKHLPISVLDGEIFLKNEYEYDSDYYLGDLVEVIGVDGNSAYRLVTEMIFSQDPSGIREYPTLSAGELDPYKTWYQGHTDIKTWADYTTEEWGDAD